MKVSFSTIIDQKMHPKPDEPMPRWKRVAIFVAKVLLALLIFPLFIPAYWSWGVEKNHTYKDPALAVDSEREKASQKFAERYAALPLQGVPWMGTVYNIPANFSLWMPGVALVGSYLCEKKNIKGLYVCETMGAFNKKLQEVIGSDQDEKCAFIVAKTSGNLIPQHKYCICLEKRDGHINVAILDAQPSERVELRSVLPKEANLFYSNTQREVAYGCEVFALRDALTFLRDPTFFEDTKITDLPPDYMVGTQSMKALEAYLEKNPILGNRPLLNKTKGLSEYLKKYQINGQNHTITRKMYKYMEIALTALENLPQDALRTARDKTFIAAA